MHSTSCLHFQLRPAGHVCRQIRSACDVAETCSGDHGDCPEDGYLIDGTPCGISGQCWKGSCADVELQCRSLWGEGLFRITFDNLSKMDIRLQYFCSVSV